MVSTEDDSGDDAPVDVNPRLYAEELKRRREEDDANDANDAGR